jgi:hypothetical protein
VWRSSVGDGIVLSRFTVGCISMNGVSLGLGIFVAGVDLRPFFPVEPIRRTLRNIYQALSLTKARAETSDTPQK